MDATLHQVSTTDPAASRPVLIVDDDKMYTLALKRFLERQGVPVVVCHSPSQALAVEATNFRAAVLDVYIEGEMDGLRLLQRLRHLHPEMPSVVITGMQSDEVRAAVRRVGASYFLAKPFRLARLFSILEHLLSVPAAELCGDPRPRALLAHGGVRSDLLLQLLESSGFRVVRAATTTEALTLLEEDTTLRLVVLQEALAGGASLVSERARSVNLGTSVLVLVEPGYNVPLHWKPQGHRTLEAPIDANEFVAAARQLTAGDAEGLPLAKVA